VDAIEQLRAGDLAAALEELQAAVRKDSADAKKRVFLFQLLAVLGDWDRALTQLNVAGDLDAGTLAMVQTYREALACEAFREAVFNGERSPLVFGEPERWIALVFEALRHSAQGRHAEAQKLRASAFDEAPITSGSINGEPFEWLADCDSRIGPFLEVIVNGNYYWAPFDRISEITFDPPSDLRDLVWMPGTFTWANGGQAVGFIPTRYVGSAASDNDDLRLSRSTDWQELGGDVFAGLGQRMFSTDEHDYSLLDIREVRLNSSDVADDAKTHADG
jgi:type VI secretion system protein ImpE